MDIASLAVFRVALGVLLGVAMLRTCAKGWVRSQFIEPAFHFVYEPFGFVRPWPGGGMYLHFAVLVIAAFGLAAGYRQRWSALVFLLGFSYVELIDRTTYLNHYYLVTLLVLLLALLPAGRAASLDVRSGRVPEARTLPAWMLWVPRCQLGLVYVYAGLAKLNADWLLYAEPLRFWLPVHAGLPVIGPLLEQPATAHAASLAGAAFDLLVVPGLLWRRTRRVAFAAVVLFHAATGLLFPIGLFPWLMVAGATLFFEPGWPRRFAPIAAWFDARARAHAGGPRRLAPLLALHVLVQLLLPLRQHLAESPSAWTLRGFDFAWNVMLAEKGGSVELVARDRQTQQRFRIAPRRYLTPPQERAMVQDPALIHALALHVAGDLRARLGRDVAIHAEAYASLNGRPAQRLIDPDVDLTRPLPEGWIVPLAARR